MIQRFFSQVKEKALPALAIGIAITGYGFLIGGDQGQGLQFEAANSQITVISFNSVSTNSAQTLYEAAEEVDDGELFIYPGDMSMNWAGRQVFTSYIQMSTQSVEVEADWSIDPDWRADAPRCEDTSTCTVYMDAGDSNFEIIAEYGDQEASVTISPNFGTIENPFIDEIPDWAALAIVSMYNRDIITGYDSGEFGADDPVTRGQFTLMLARMSQFFDVDTDAVADNLDCDLYDDVSSSHYAHRAICFGGHYGWFDNVDIENDRFRPNEELTREIAAQITFNVIVESTIENSDYYGNYAGTSYEEMFWEDLEEMASESFQDLNDDNPYLRAIGGLYDEGIMSGNGNEFQPEGVVNRAQAAVILRRAKWGIDNP